MKNFTLLILLGFACSTWAQYGIPDDEDDMPRVRAPNPAFYTSKYGSSAPVVVTKVAPAPKVTVPEIKTEKVVTIPKVTYPEQKTVIQLPAKSYEPEIRVTPPVKLSSYSATPAVKISSYSETPAVKLSSYSAPPAVKLSSYSATPAVKLSSYSAPPAVKLSSYSATPAVKLSSYSAPTVPVATTRITFQDDGKTAYAPLPVKVTHQPVSSYVTTAHRAEVKNDYLPASAPISTKVHAVSSPVTVARESYSHPQTHSAIVKTESYKAPVKHIHESSDTQGSFKYETVFADGSAKQKSGQMKNLGGKEVQVMSGSYSFTGGDGKVYKVDWKADENGYTAVGDHLPKSTSY